VKTKTMLSFAVAAIAAVAMAIPAFASASEWKDSGKALTNGPHWSKEGASLKGESASTTLSGLFAVEGPPGGVECTLSFTATLEPGSSAQTSGGSLSNCKARGGINNCKVTSATIANLPPLKAAEVEGKRIVTTSWNLVAESTMEGIFCPKTFAFSVSVTGTPDNSAAISSLSLSGKGIYEMDGVTGSANVLESSLAMSPAAKYGILVKNTVKLGGEMSWESNLGGITCSVSGTLELSAGSSGQVTAFNWSGCGGTGSFASCKASMTSNSLPWSATDEGTTIKISGVSFSLKTESGSCPPYKWPVTGELTATPDKTSAIGNTGLEGQLKDGSGSKMNWLGPVNWTPAGIYGL